MYEPVIGLEVHLQLKTKTKAFCGCSTEFGQSPNSQTCVVCLGFPGSLPVLNKQALDYAVKVALALDCRVQEYTKFDRKNYFYPDLPKAYQISQYDLPLAKGGLVNIVLNGNPKGIGITRVHMEEDAGKLMHRGEISLVDFNRAGIPLLEIVSEPEINSPEEAHEYLATLKNIVGYLDVSDCDMEKGSLRCDANISLRKKGDSKLGIKTELKNMNSFKAVKDALHFEIKRQQELLLSGEGLVQDTRLWDAKQARTISMRTKEGAQDYRYFPEPDLPPFIISREKTAEIKESIPELPQNKVSRFMKDYGLSEYDAKILASFRRSADYAEECLKAYPHRDKKTLVNFLNGPLLSEANSRNCPITELKIPGGREELIKLVDFIETGKVSNLTAKAVFSESLLKGKPPCAIIQEGNLFQVSDQETIKTAIEEVIRENHKSVADYTQGKTNALMFLVGQVMRKSGGRANPKVIQELLRKRLNAA